MPEPITIGALALGGLAWMGAGIVGNVSDRVLCTITRGFKDRVAGLRGLPENHDVARAVRIAQIQALEKVIRDYREVGRPEWVSEPYTHPGVFFDYAVAFCTRTIGRCFNPKVKLSLEVSKPLTAAIDGILADPANDRPAAQRANKLATLSEEAVLDELRAEIDGVVLPDGFEQHFRSGNAGRPRFLDLFGAYVAEQVKSDERFSAILTIGKLSGIEALAFDTTELLSVMEKRFGATLGRIETKFDVVSADVAVVRQTQADHSVLLREILYGISAERGVPLATLKTILAGFGELNVTLDPGHIEQRLTVKAEEYRTLSDRLNRLSNTDPEVRRLRREAAAALDRGDFPGADRLLAQAEARDLSGIEDLEAFATQKRISAAESRAERAAAAKLRLMYRDAAEHYAKAASIVVPADAAKARDYRIDQGVMLLTLGKEFGDNDALREAIEHFKSLLAHADCDVDAIFCAVLESHLGDALLRLGMHDSGPDLLEEAVVVCRTALCRFTRERAPLEWARAQNSLANALAMLGAREGSMPRLEEALLAYRTALLERTRERVPVDWAMTLNNLGNVLQMISELEDGTARLEEAIAAHRAALEELTRERAPLAWATVWSSLAGALGRLGQREWGTARLEEAVAACRVVLDVWTRERVPLDWAHAQMTLAVSLATIADRRFDPTLLEEVVVACRSALDEYTRERVPLQWAMAQTILGAALAKLGEREAGTARLGEAVAAYRAALTEHTLERVPLKWAATQNNLGCALRMLGDRESDIARLEEAVASHRAALKEWTRERAPLDWAATQNDLGIALRMLGSRKSDTAPLEEAVASHRAALEECTRERDPLDWATIQTNLADALQALGERERVRGA